MWVCKIITHFDKILQWLIRASFYLHGHCSINISWVHFMYYTIPYSSNSLVLSNKIFKIKKKIFFFSDIVNLKGLGHGIKNLHIWYSVFVYFILFSTCVYTCLVLYISSNCNKIFHYNQNHFLALTVEVIETSLRTSSADPP